MYNYYCHGYHVQSHQGPNPSKSIELFLVIITPIAETVTVIKSDKRNRSDENT